MGRLSSRRGGQRSQQHAASSQKRRIYHYRHVGTSTTSTVTVRLRGPQLPNSVMLFFSPAPPSHPMHTANTRRTKPTPIDSTFCACSRPHQPAGSGWSGSTTECRLVISNKCSRRVLGCVLVAAGVGPLPCKPLPLRIPGFSDVYPLPPPPFLECASSESRGWPPLLSDAAIASCAYLCGCLCLFGGHISVFPSSYLTIYHGPKRNIQVIICVPNHLMHLTVVHFYATFSPH